MKTGFAASSIRTKSRCCTWYFTSPIASAPMPTARVSASGLALSITPTPASPSGGTALTSAATSMRLAWARSVSLMTCTPAAPRTQPVSPAMVSR